MLRWSAENTHRTVDLRSIADPSIDAGLPGSMPLARLARESLGRVPDPTPTLAVADAIGEHAAVDAAAVAAAFELFNRVVDGTGLPVGTGSRRSQADDIQLLGLDRFSHASVGRDDTPS